jgi:hypothetical protein
MNEVQVLHKKSMHSQKYSFNIQLLILNNNNDSNHFLNKVQIIVLTIIIF